MDREKACWYSLAFESGLTAREVNRLWNVWSGPGRESLAVLYDSEAADIPVAFGPSERKGIASAREALKSAESVMETCAESGVAVVTLADDAYPARLRTVLGETSPPVLFVTGELALVGNPCVAIVGSREATDVGIEFARGMGEALAARGWTVVSGLAKGIDRTAMGSALEAGGTVIAVLPHGILARPRDLAAMKDPIEGGRLAVLSQFQPTAPWQVGLAMARNSTVIGLSRAVIVADAGETGGTREAAQAALKRKLPVYVRPHEGEESPGLAVLVRKGARVAAYDAESPGNAVERLLAEIGREDKPASPPGGRQGRLF